MYTRTYLNTGGTTAVATSMEPTPHASPLVTSSSVLPSSPSPLLSLPTSSSLLSSPTVGSSLTVSTPQRQTTTPGMYLYLQWNLRDRDPLSTKDTCSNPIPYNTLVHYLTSEIRKTSHNRRPHCALCSEVPLYLPTFRLLIS